LRPGTVLDEVAGRGILNPYRESNPVHAAR